MGVIEAGLCETVAIFPARVRQYPYDSLESVVGLLEVRLQVAAGGRYGGGGAPSAR